MRDFCGSKNDLRVLDSLHSLARNREKKKIEKDLFNSGPKLGFVKIRCAEAVVKCAFAACEICNWPSGREG